MKSKVFYKMPEMTARNAGGFLKVWKHIGLMLLAVLFTTQSFANAGPPNPIQGPTAVCLQSTIFLTDDSPGGTWSVDNSSIAFVNPDGSVFGNGVGQAVITYATVGGTVTTTITVNPVPGPTFLVQGGGSTCAGGSGVPITLLPSQSGIIYQVYVDGIPIGTPMTGTGSPLNFGLFTTPGSYTIKGTNGFGCSSWMTGSVTVTNSGPTAFAEQGILECGGTTTVFVGANGGQPPYSGTGEFTGVGAGIHTYTVTDDNGCMDIVTINVVASSTPPIMSEGTSVCVGQTLPMGIDASGGTWSTSSGSIATISATGVLYGVAAGLAGVTYTLPSGCFSAIQVTVNPLSPIVGGAAVMCQGTTMTVNTATPGTGSWYTDDGDVAVASGTGNTAVIYGTGGGTTVIHYMSDAGCITSRTITVNPMAMLDMSGSVCVGQTDTASTSIGGGTWSSLNPGIATVNSMGVIYGVSAGTATIRYILPTGCYTDMSIVVSALSPIMPAGTLSLCQGSSMTVTNSTPGGSSWYGGEGIISIVGSTGSAVVTGESAGTTVITFSGNGCTTTKSITVKASVAIEGPTSVCVGQTIMLTNTVAGGTWSSSSASIATVSPTGLVLGRAAGTVTIMYLVNGCLRSHVVTVNPLLATAPGGVSTICQGQTLTLTNATATASSWFSGDPAVATLTYTGGTAVVYGAGGGTTTITFMSNMGCMYTKSVTVNPGAPIQGPSSVCVGQTIALSDSVTGGTWISSSASIATVGANTGIVKGVAAGNVTIYYSVGGCNYSKVIAVNALNVITPTTAPAICAGQTITLANSTAGGGAWSSGNTEVAVINSSTTTSAVISGASTGIALISFTSTAGCVTTRSVTVSNGAPITGPSSVCVGQTITLSNPAPGGTWSSGMMSTATVGAGTGIVTGSIAGTVNIIYTLPGGCNYSKAITVNALNVITPTTAPAICAGQTITLANSTAGGGVWTSSNTEVAVINSSTATSAVIGGASTGTALISFTSTAGCVTTRSVTVSSGAPITGPSSVCVGQTITLSNPAPGGTWSSSMMSTATVGSGTGIVTGSIAGTVNIIYTLPGGCNYSKAITVNALNVITPTNVQSVCVGRSIILNNNTAGIGAWSSSNTEVATLGAGTSSTYTTVWGVSAGTVVISYTSSMGCVTTRSVNVVPASPVLGPSSVCVGQTIALSNATGGGTWSSSAASIATVGVNSGIVTGVGAGNVTIIYTYPSGCSYSMVVTVNALNVITPTTAPAICAGQTITLANSTAGGGVWTSSNTEVAVINSSTATSAVIGGASTGTALISFTSTAGCVTTRSVTVSAGAPITGPSSVCVGQTITLSNAAPGGTWSSGMMSTATVGSGTGVVTGSIAGTVNIIYTLPGGCNYSKAITVNALNVITPTNVQSVCVGRSIILNNNTAGIGAWSSSNTEVATLGAGTSSTYTTVWGVSAGTVVISYTSSMGCVTTRSVNVVPASPVLGPSSVCVGQTIALSNATGGGTWSSSAASIATVGVNSGIVTGVGAGNVTIIYTYPSGCSYSMVVTVNALNVITPTTAPAICAGQTITLANSTAGGGLWTSSNTEVAVINSSTATSAVIGGASTGTALISFTSTAGCVTTRSVTVSAGAPITGPSSVCVGQTITLSNAAPGGTWSSGMMSIATVGSGTGVVTGAIAGTVNIIYTLPGGCNYSKSILVNALNVITPTNTQTVCVGRSIVLNNTTAGIGAWSSSNTAIATLGTGTSSTYITVWGASAGTVTISYTSAAGCVTTRDVIITDAAPIVGLSSVCVGQTITLSNTVGGGTWASSTGSVATVGINSGVVTGVAGGNATIIYTYPSGCSYTMLLTVNPLASIQPGGTPAVCEGRTTTFTNSTGGGGVWTAETPATADVISQTSSSAVIQGMSAGTGVISFTSNVGGCVTTRTITVNATAQLSGAATICTGETLQLSSSIGGGTWSTSAVAIATVNSSGLLTANAGGNVTIYYTLPGGCNNTMTMTINPAAMLSPAGSLTICQGQYINLTNNVPGGIWATDAAAVATLNVTSPTTAQVWGAGPGSTTITYTTAAGCVTTKNVTTVAGPTIIVPSTVCVGQTITLGLGSGPTNGYWYSGADAIATVSPLGEVRGRTEGTVTIYNVLPGGCNSSAQVTVLPLSPITGGVSTLCLGNVMMLANSTPGGGVWGTNNNTIADIQTSTTSTATVIATGTGNTEITFTAVNGCVATRPVTVVVCKPTGISNNNVAGYDVSLFPNPTSGVLTLQGELGVQTNEEVSIQVIDMTGRIILTDNTTAKNGVVNKQIDVTDKTANGMYILSVRFADQQKLYHFTVQH